MGSKFKISYQKELISPKRYTPDMESAEISYEHWHRYLSVINMVAEKKVLDVGCGEGYGANLLVNYAKEVVGIDIDRNIIRRAAKKYKNPSLKFLVGNVQKMPIKGNNLFDVVLCFETIEHLTSSEQLKFLNEVKRVLKRDGQFVVSTPDKKNYSDDRGFKNPYHKKEFYKKEFIKFLEKSFKYVDIYGQKIFPASFIWHEDGQKNASGYNEFQIRKTQRGFSPTIFKEKSHLVLIAVCSDRKIDNLTESVCIDLDEVLIKGREEEIELMKNMLNEKDRYIKSLLSHLKTKEKELSKLVSSLK